MQKEIEENQPSLRLCDVERPSTGSCGFHLTRTAWDPYPWVSGVEAGSAAEAAGLQSGDCVLEVNGEDVLGQRIGEVASRVRARGDRVTLLLWNAGSDPHTAATSISGNGTTPVSLQRLSTCLQSVLQLLECPVCLETVPPPAFQCCNGHVLCGGCRARADRCPVCRVSLGPRGRCLLADKLHSLLTTTLNRYNNAKNKATPKKKNINIQQPTLYLKSRIVTPCMQENYKTDDNESNSRAILMKNSSVDVQLGSHSDNCEQSHTNASDTRHAQQRASSTENIPSSQCSVSDDQDNADGESISQTSICLSSSNDSESTGQEVSLITIQPKSSSVENISSCNQQTPTRKISEQTLSTYSIEGSSASPLRARSLSAGQIPVRNDSPPPQNSVDKISPREVEELLLHCPFPIKSQSYCRCALKGTRMLLQHIREDHQGPIVQYFLQSSCPAVTVRLPLSSTKRASSSLMSFTTQGDVVFFVQVAAGATPGHRLVWLWLMGDALQAERYRLRLTLPEGDTHTGPVFPLTASWNDVVNSNCCLSIEERRYLRGNPQVQLEILDLAKTN